MELPDLLNAVLIGAVCYAVVRVVQWLSHLASAK